MMGFISRFTDLFSILGPLKEVVAILAGGSIAAAVAVAACFVLDMPVVRAVWGGFLWGLGKAMSLLFVRWFGKWGQRIEGRLQVFAEFSGDRFFAGLDQDDK